MHRFHNPWVHGSLEATLKETLGSTQRAWTKLQKNKTQNRTPGETETTIEDQGLRYPALRYPDSIRVLELLPALSETTPLACRLRSGRIGSAYEALSYVWGDVSDTVDLHCEGKTTGITQNLDAALRHVRYHDRSRYLWVDAVCINQRDMAERGHQVKLTRKIYKYAKGVLVWIGKDEPYVYHHSVSASIGPEYPKEPWETRMTKATYTFELFHRIYDHITVNFADLDKVLAKDWSSPETMAWERELANRRKERRQRPLYDKTWEVMETFFAFTWFYRQWVIQEVVVAS
ncbi:heterokaryon incompatibility protein-domain-containing protein [Massariosphaeria phaeospora]|uniref:Heterokaryon incompatibility protein-domain-containing protein n=1 Tax=Massariosphaeria phaeospora TaxID=100035 RepID=A0A7C8MX21_9PLEO|nr:heterokaryon incompatibility protein-domain-containing protein [Massariosphaeria phaeospora]